ncbi:MAG: hypothetical protein ACYC5K_09215, partial [Saccharofermentanales bacterium]
TRNGLKTRHHDELVFFIIKPTNISVLSRDSIAGKIRNLMNLLSAFELLGVCCMDAYECFDENKLYLESRIAEEQTLQVKQILLSDLLFLDEIQLQMSTAREFMFIFPARTGSDENSFTEQSRIEKQINDHGFEVRKALKSDIKRFLGIYFTQNVPGEELPDYDGENAAASWVIDQ